MDNISVRRSAHNASALFDRERGCYVMRLPDGGRLLIDEQDLWVLDIARWNDRRYVEANTALHRVLCPSPPDKEVDHKNGIRYDNRKHNLRVTTSQENNRNKKKRRNASSRFKGVCWSKEKNRWHVYIRYGDRVLKKIGHTHDEEEAARIYDVAATTHFGEHAKTNESLGLFQKKPDPVVDWEPKLEHPLDGGGSTVVDEEDKWAVFAVGWHCNKKGYIEGKLLMHRLIMRPAKDQEVTIINGNPYDMRRENLHLCVGRDFRRFRTRPNKGRKYKGVYAKKNGRFSAAIRVNGRLQHIGNFATEEQASEAYQSAASQLIIK